MVKHAYSLKVPKKAKDAEDFLCEGHHLVAEAFKSGLKFRFIFFTKESLSREEGSDLFERAQRGKIRCFEAPQNVIGYMADTVTPQGVIAVVKKPDLTWPEMPFGTLLGIHQVQDAGNLGTLFRSAEAFGVRGIFLTEGTCDPFNPKVVRSSMGSLLRIPFITGKTWSDYMTWLKGNGFQCYALSQDGSKTLGAARFEAPMILWVGAEGAGLPRELVEMCDERLSIPMQGEVESLNVGVAASIALFKMMSNSML